MNVKPSKKKVAQGSKIKQIVAIVKYLSDLAVEEKIKVRPLWLDPIPAKIFVDELEIYFAVTASTTNSVRYKTQQNFKTMLTMQLNDVTDYSIVVGKTDGLVPSKNKGRGLIALDRVYEFQTAYCSDAEDIQDYVRVFCKELAENANSYAKPVPVLPNVVNYKYVLPYINSLENIHIGVGKKNLNIITVNLANKVVYPVVAQDTYETIVKGIVSEDAGEFTPLNSKAFTMIVGWCM